MRTSKRFHAIRRIIFYPFHWEKRINIASRNLMITRSCQEVDFLCSSHSASLYLLGHRAIPSLARGDLDYGMIRLECHLVWEEVRFVCPRYQTRSGSSARQRKIICLSKIPALSGAMRALRGEQTKRRLPIQAALRLQASPKARSLPLSA